MQYAGSSQEQGVNSSIDCPCHYPCNPTVLLSQPAAAPKVPECAPAATVAAVQRKCTTYTLVELMMNHCSFPAPHCAHPPSPPPPAPPPPNTQAQEGAQQVLLFHQQQAEAWGLLSDSINTYVDSVRDLAEQMAVDGKQQGYYLFIYHFYICI
jgi:hypothetical protein